MMDPTGKAGEAGGGSAGGGSDTSVAGTGVVGAGEQCWEVVLLTWGRVGSSISWSTEEVVAEVRARDAQGGGGGKLW